MGRGKTVEDWDAWTEAMQAKHGNGNGHGKSLEIEAQRLLPTPQARDHKDQYVGNSGGHRPGDTDSVPRAVRDMGTDFGPYTAAIRRWEQVLGRPAPSPTEPGANGRPRLSPAFVEWMQGLPDGWVTGVGIPRSAQLKALGNGVVPQQAALALAMLDGDGAAVPPPLPDGAQLLGTPNAHERTHTPRQVASGIQLANQIDELVNGADR
jgi:DNA (cytosine-5)-methyltransferase 1